jgi:hypothetical protein
MKREINRLSLIAGTILVFVVYSICLFLLADLGRAVFWIGYLFTLAAFALGDVILWFKLVDPFDARSFFYQFPVSRLCFTHDVLAMILGAVFAALPGVQVKIVFIVELILLAAFLIIDVYSLMGVQKAADMQQEKTSKIADFRLMESRLRTIAQNCDAAVLTEKINRLAEDFHFSDPMSNDEVARLDRALYQQISDLQELTEKGRLEEALTCVREMDSSLKTRNRICKTAHSERS